MPLDFISDAILLAPAVIPHLKSGFYKSYDYMLQVIERMVTQVYNGVLGGDFVDILGSLIKGQLTQAYQAAWEDSGETSHPVPDFLQPDLDAAVEQQANFDYIYNYYKDTINARVDGTPLRPLIDRAKLWASQYDTAYKNAERLINIRNGGNLVWRKGKTEHGCRTCAALDGLVLSAREWDALDLHPQGYPNPKLECGGGGPANNCDCKLEKTDKRRSPKGYDTALNIVVSASTKDYNPDQPRDERGRFGSGGGESGGEGGKESGESASGDSEQHDQMMSLSETTTMSAIQSEQLADMKKAYTIGEKLKSSGYSSVNDAIRRDDDFYESTRRMSQPELVAIESGFRGDGGNFEFVVAWRVGDVPENGLSMNFTDQRLEPGLSVMETSNGLETSDKISKMFIMSKGRPVVYVSGFVHPFKKGSDGEPLLIQVKTLKKVPPK